LPQSLQSSFVLLPNYDLHVAHCPHRSLPCDRTNRILPISTVHDRYNQSFLSPPLPPAWPPTNVLLVILRAPSSIEEACTIAVKPYFCLILSIILSRFSSSICFCGSLNKSS